MEKVQVNISISKEAKEYFQKKAKEKGMSMSLAMDLALQQAMDMQRGLEAIGQGDLTKYMENIAQKLDKLDEGDSKSG